MPTIFINYRREDGAGYAGRIHERLASVFGSESVFIDLDDIPPGVDFVSKIQETVAACDVMLVLITRRWLELRDAAGRRRIDDPADFVRIEIGKALARNIRVIPVLTNNASMPAEKDLRIFLHGHVAAADSGAPLRSARVQAIPATPAIPPALTDASGGSAVAVAVDRPSRLSVTKPGFLPVTIETPAADREVEIRLRQAGAIAGHITDTLGDAVMG